MKKITRIPKVTADEDRPPYGLHLTFDDGLERDVDLADQLWGPVFEPLKDPEVFAQVTIDQRDGLLAERGRPRSARAPRGLRASYLPKRPPSGLTRGGTSGEAAGIVRHWSWSFAGAHSSNEWRAWISLAGFSRDRVSRRDAGQRISAR